MAAPNVRPGGAPKEDRSVGELLGELAQETSALVRQEMNLAKVELSDKVTKVGKQVGAIAIGGAVLYAGLLTLIAALVLLLAQLRVIDAWASALIIGAIVTGTGGVLIKKGMEGLRQADPVPHATIETLKEDSQWAKERTK